MKIIDYENLFIYMSLIFAVSIFIILLYGCAYANIKPPMQIFENFEVNKDLKSEILPLLKGYENKGTDSENKLISELIIKIENKTITVTDLTSLIELLKKISPPKEDIKKESDVVSGTKNETVKGDTVKTEIAKSDTVKSETASI
jgi:hypothetical protein